MKILINILFLSIVLFNIGCSGGSRQLSFEEIEQKRLLIKNQPDKDGVIYPKSINEFKDILQESFESDSDEFIEIDLKKLELDNNLKIKTKLKEDTYYYFELVDNRANYSNNVSVRYGENNILIGVNDILSSFDEFMAFKSIDDVVQEYNAHLNLKSETPFVDTDDMLLSIQSKCDIVLDKLAFTNCYITNKKISIWSAYTLTHAETSQSLPRLDDFKPDLELPKKDRVYSYDYTNTGYDRGHLAPNANMDFDLHVQEESFLMSNIVPQKPKLNRSAMAAVESIVREKLKTVEKLYIITGAIPSKSKYFMNKNINIPNYIFKIIYDPQTKKEFTYLFPQRDLEKKDIARYLTTKDQVEAKFRKAGYYVKFTGM
jgi:endonuclease G